MTEDINAVDAINDHSVWELLDRRKQTYRMPVPGGWILKDSGYHNPALIFIRDPKHKWEPI
jgi:hypothetical protein